MSQEFAPKSEKGEGLFEYLIEQVKDDEIPAHISPALRFVREEGKTFIGSLRLMHDKNRATRGFFKKALGKIKFPDKAQKLQYQEWLDGHHSRQATTPQEQTEATHDPLAMSTYAIRYDPALLVLRSLEKIRVDDFPSLYRIDEDSSNYRNSILATIAEIHPVSPNTQNHKSDIAA